MEERRGEWEEKAGKAEAEEAVVLNSSLLVEGMLGRVVWMMVECLVAPIRLPAAGIAGSEVSFAAVNVVGKTGTAVAVLGLAIVVAASGSWVGTGDTAVVGNLMVTARGDGDEVAAGVAAFAYAKVAPLDALHANPLAQGAA